MTVWLNAALAFSLAMIVFSTMALAVTEAIQRALRLRAADLQNMLGRFVDEVVIKTLDVAATEKEKIVNRLASNLVGTPGDTISRWSLRAADSISVEEVVQRLAGSDLSTKILAAADPKALIANLTRQFERFEGDATALFARRARLISVLASIGLAFALNIDAARLFSTFLSDQELAARFLAQAEAIKKEAQQLSLPNTKAPGEVAELQRQVEDVQKKVEASTALGLPIGNRFYPYCEADKLEGWCSSAHTTGIAWRRRVTWFISVVIAGLLIGLGGPFWFDAFAKLSSFAQAPGAARASGATTPQSAAAPKSRPDALWDLFQTAAANQP